LEKFCKPLLKSSFLRLSNSQKPAIASPRRLKTRYL
jgi:hypothetical protein